MYFLVVIALSYFQAEGDDFVNHVLYPVGSRKPYVGTGKLQGIYFSRYILGYFLVG